MSRELPVGGAGPFADLIGLKITECAEGYSRCELEVTPAFFNPNGVAHGALAYALADTSMGTAVYLGLGPDEFCATVEIKMVYLRAVRQGPLTCESRVIKRGKGVALLESELLNGDRRVATATGTYAILKKEA